MHKSATMTEQGVKVVQVLFEYQGSKHQLTLTPSLVCETITRELAKFGKDGVIVKLSNAASSSSSPAVYLLQKWSSSWGAYIDVESVGDIKDKDRLTVVPMPVGSPKVRRLCNNRLCKKWAIL